MTVDEMEERKINISRISKYNQRLEREEQELKEIELDEEEGGYQRKSQRNPPADNNNNNNNSNVNDTTKEQEKEAEQPTNINNNNNNDISQYFNPNYLKIDRIIDMEPLQLFPSSSNDDTTSTKKRKSTNTNNNNSKTDLIWYLVKWKSLTYEECTWEKRNDLYFKRINLSLNNTNTNNNNMDGGILPNEPSIVTQKIKQFERISSQRARERVKYSIEYIQSGAYQTKLRQLEKLIEKTPVNNQSILLSVHICC